MNGWTPERRKRQAQLIQQWKPWQRSTGAKTEEGKARSSQNALKHGFRSREQIELRKQMNQFIRLSEEATSAIYQDIILLR